MKICYVDESGCTGILRSATSQIQPVITLAAIVFDTNNLATITNDLINLKKRFYPNLAPANTTHLGWMMHEVKGADLRRDLCNQARNPRRQASGYLGGILRIASLAGARHFGRVWVKGIGAPLNGMAVYTYSLQTIFTSFQRYLEQHDDVGIVIMDARLKHLNTPVAHSIFTQKFKQTGDAYPRILELPAFSHSDNHAGLQICDTICSAIINPIAIHTYCSGHVQSVHVRGRYADVKAAFASDCAFMQYRYTDVALGRRGGFTVADGIAQRSGRHLFT
jgi:Protein of unknown function (DUF3800)